MHFSFGNLLGALVFLVLGIALLALFRRFAYPVLSARYERAKATLSQGQNPARLTRAVYLIGLLLFPVIGFVVGGMVW